VDQARNNVRQTAAFARRVVCRTLTVVGGVAAGTALAWCLSTAAASADVPVPDPVGDGAPVAVAAVQELARPVTEPVERVVGTVAEFVQDPPPPPQNPLGELSDKVKDAAGQFRARAERGIEDLPDCAGEVCVGGHEYVADAFGRSGLPSAPGVTPVAPVALAPGIDLDAIANGTGSAEDRATAGGMSRRGSPAPVAPSRPGLPDWPVPFAPAPAGIPTTGNHGSAGNSFDSHLFAALPWRDSDVDLVAGGIAAAADAATFGRPGTQPGVAPD
jgi:hypothetical protein